jgi:seryl-tRNA synthetase
MLDPKRIRLNQTEVRDGFLKRNHTLVEFEKYIVLDQEWRTTQQQIDKKINQRKQMQHQGVPSPDARIALKELSLSIKSLQDKVAKIESDLQLLGLSFPNIPLADVPDGKDELSNKVIRKIRPIPDFDFDINSHEVVGQQLGLLDFESAAKISGSRFVVYRGQGAKLERALINFMLDTHTQNHGYEEVLPPVLVHERALYGTGQLPKFGSESFNIQDTPLWLSPTSEVQLTNLYRETIIPESGLPLKITAGTACFRKEAGSYGRDVKGIIRQHQFNKVELVQLTTPEQSSDALTQLLSHAANILDLLQLPYRIVELCTGDLGFSAMQTFDIEVWFPFQKKYREISSCSLFGDFQSRRSMIRYKCSKSGKVNYLHTLNGSGLAVGRTIAAILENLQQKDGTVILPDVLHSYMGESVLK